MSIKPVLILGAGGHAKVVAEMARLLRWEILGFITPDLAIGADFCGSRVLGDDSVVSGYNPEEIALINGIGALPGQDLRWKLASMMQENAYLFPVIIHPNAIVAEDVELACGVQIMAGSILQPGVRIGQDSIINTRASIDHDCQIGSHCHIAPGVTLSGNVKIQNSVHIGTGATIIQNVSVGSESVVSAGTCVFKDIPKSTVFRQTD